MMSDPKVPKHHNEALDEALKNQILKILQENPSITQKDIVQSLEISRASVQRIMTALVKQGKIERINSKRYGHWEVH